MKKLSRHIIFGIFIFTLSSCATMFNSKEAFVSIITSEPSNFVLGDDTIKSKSTNRTIAVERSNEPLRVSVYNDSLSKTIIIKSRNSFAYWLNAYPNLHLWTGFYIDTKTNKRYTYPKTVYIDFAQKDSSYLTYEPLKEPYNQYSNIFKITPLKLLGLINPSIELSYERKTGKRFSTQLMASYLFPKSFVEIGNDFKPEIRGYNLSIEEKFYFKKSAAIGPYLSFEFNYLKRQNRDIWNFGEEDIHWDTTYNFTNYSDTFGIKKQTYSFNLKIGYQLIIKRLSVDVYAGLGLKYRDVEHFDRINPEDEMGIPRHPNFYYAANKEGKYWTVSIPLNIRVGWTF